jgi:WD40 repeat protein
MAWEVRGASRLLTLGEDTIAAGEHSYVLSLPSPNGHTVARSGSGKLWFEDARTGLRTTTAVPNHDSFFTWSPDARWLLSGGQDGILKLWDRRSGALAADTPLDEGTDPNEVLAAFSGDSRTIYVRTSGSAIGTLHTTSLRPAYDDIELARYPRALLPHPDGSVIALLDDGSFLRVKPETGEIVTHEPPGLLPTEDQAGVLSPDGTRMAVSDAYHSVRLLDLETRQWLGSNSQTPVGSELFYAPDGGQFATLQPERVRLWDGRTGEYQASLPLPSRTAQLSITYLPDSSGLIIATTDGRTWVVDTRTNMWVQRACSIAGRNLTQADWQHFFPNQSYEVTCPEWPAGI